MWTLLPILSLSCKAVSKMSSINGLTALLVFIILTGQIETHEVSKKIWDYLSIRNGVFTNKAEIKGNESLHDLVQTRYIPLKVPKLSDVPALFIERSVNRNITIFVLGVLTEGNTGTVHMTQYYCKLQNTHEPMAPFNASELLTLADEFFYLGENCSGEYELVGHGVFAGQFTLCTDDLINGFRPLYTVTHGCDKIMFTVPPGGYEKLPASYYIQHREGDRFPVPDVPNDYVSPCDKNNQ